MRFAIVTDIERDGMLSGANTAMLAELKKATNLNLIASGGVRDMADIRALASLGIYGAIAGKSIYQGTLDLKKPYSIANPPEVSYNARKAHYPVP